MTDDKELKNIWDAGLTEEEYCIIGNIVAQWGALEAEVFGQTLIAFGSDMKVDQLPREMNNLNFAAVLTLWKERVVDTSEGETKKVLQEAYEKVLEFKDIRNSIVHGMWDFSLTEPQTIFTMRVKRDQLIHTIFKDGYLADFATNIAQLNADIRYPGGLVDFFKDQMKQGYYVNEAALRRMKLDSKQD